MFIPIADDNSDRTLTPWCTYAFIAMNVFFFAVLQQGGEDVKFTYAYSCVPEEILTGRDLVTPSTEVEVPITHEKVEMPGLQPTPISPYITLITSMFLHGSWMHLLGNMLFLFIFGDNVEDRLGHLGYVVFYLVCGVLAALAHVLVSFVSGMDGRVPCLGASGAISGVLAGYVVIHPHRRVTVLIFRFITDMPAYAVIGIWFAFQMINGYIAVSDPDQPGGVAYGAHVGGFVAGAAIVWAFPWRGPPKPKSPFRLNRRNPDTARRPRP